MIQFDDPSIVIHEGLLWKFYRFFYSSNFPQQHIFTLTNRNIMYKFWFEQIIEHLWELSQSLQSRHLVGVPVLTSSVKREENFNIVGGTPSNHIHWKKIVFSSSYFCFLVISSKRPHSGHKTPGVKTTPEEETFYQLQGWFKGGYCYTRFALRSANGIY